jgi:hypothetical protein
VKQSVSSPQPLNEVQVMLLRLFSRPVADDDLQAIREMLLSYYNTALQNELDRVIEEKKLTRTHFDDVL